MSTSEFGEKLFAAIEGSRVNVNNFVWKGPKVAGPDGKYKQEEFKLIEASPEQLQKAYKHCKTMLFNTDPGKPGRVNLLKIIAQQRNSCGVELFFRQVEKKGTARFAVVNALRNAISEAKMSTIEADSLMLGDIVTTESDFQTLPVRLVIDGGIDRLGIFDRSHITLALMLKQGLWFTAEEKAQHSALFSPDLSVRDRMAEIKNQLNLQQTSHIQITPQGLTFTELKAMLSLKSKKYSELSRDQLETLRNKLLFALEDEVNQHIEQWNERISQIEQVAEINKIDL